MLVTITGLLQFLNVLKDKTMYSVLAEWNGLLVCWLCWYLEHTCDAAQSTTHQLYFQMSISGSPQHLQSAVHSMLERKSTNLSPLFNRQTLNFTQSWDLELMYIMSPKCIKSTNLTVISSLGLDDARRDGANQGLAWLRRFNHDHGLKLVFNPRMGLWDECCCFLLQVTSFV